MAATILLVEDERKLRDLVRSYLEQAGFAVLSTRSGAEALSLAASASPDLLILDLGLPDIAGETVARELRAASSVTILMLTAKSSEEDRVKAWNPAPMTMSPSRSARAKSCCGSRRSCAAAARPARRASPVTGQGRCVSTRRSTWP